MILRVYSLIKGYWALWGLPPLSVGLWDFGDLRLLGKRV